MKKSSISRRNFLGKAAMVGVAGVVTPSIITSCDTTKKIVSGPAMPDQVSPELLGPPVYYAPDMARLQQRVPDTSHPQFYPIPQGAITRDTYMEWLEDSGYLDYAANPKRGTMGPRELLPSLAKYVQTGDRKWGEACLDMLKDFHRGVEELVARKGWTDLFVEEPATIPLYRRYLIQGGLLDPEKDLWFKEMFLYYVRTLHVWGSPDTFWRGPCHRAQPEGIMRGLAAKWYPDIPEAAAWQHYSQQVYQDFWEHKDLTENDTGYIMDPSRANLTSGEELRGTDEFITNPEMLKVWERFLAEVTPDGSINPYGPHSGWNATAPGRVWRFELIAAKTRDGKYRFAAHKLMNYILYQKEKLRASNYGFGRLTTERIALAYLFTDDSVRPVAPSPASQVLYRKQVVQVAGKEGAVHFLKDLDPSPDKAKPCCYMVLTGEVVPSKFVFRSGWNPGDLYALVDLFIGWDPLNPGGIIGLTRWGAPFTQVCSAKGSSVENRLNIEDLSGKAPRRYRKVPNCVIGGSWGRGGGKNGESASARMEIPIFEDMGRATFAAVTVTDWQAFPVKVTREYVFIKNRFLLMRDLAEFEEGFEARVGPVWNTQNVGPQVGPNWANTFFSEPVGADGGVFNNTPPLDLLVFHAPQPGCRLQIVDRTVIDARTSWVPAQVRYVWQGEAKAGQKMHFTQVYYPHAPYRWKVVSNHAGAEREWIGGEMAATAGAAGIRMLLDTPAASIACVTVEEDRTEWIVCNPEGTRLEAGGLVTDARYAYVDAVKGKPVTASAVGATFLSLDGAEILRQQERKNAET